MANRYEQVSNAKPSDIVGDGSKKDPIVITHEPARALRYAAQLADSRTALNRLLGRRRVYAHGSLGHQFDVTPRRVKPIDTRAERQRKNLDPENGIHLAKYYTNILRTVRIK